MHVESTSYEPRCPQVSKITGDTAADFRLHCPRCGGAFLAMVDLLFHPCQQQPKQPAPSWPAKRPKPRENRAGVSRA